LAAEADEDWSGAEGVPDWLVEEDCHAGCDAEVAEVTAAIASAAAARSSRNCLPRPALFRNRFGIVPLNPPRGSSL
jgi:hypothetical protein